MLLLIVDIYRERRFALRRWRRHQGENKMMQNWLSASGIVSHIFQTNVMNNFVEHMIPNYFWNILLQSRKSKFLFDLL